VDDGQQHSPTLGTWAPTPKHRSGVTPGLRLERKGDQQPRRGRSASRCSPTPRAERRSRRPLSTPQPCICARHQRSSIARTEAIRVVQTSTSVEQPATRRRNWSAPVAHVSPTVRSAPRGYQRQVLLDGGFRELSQDALDSLSRPATHLARSVVTQVVHPQQPFGTSIPPPSTVTVVLHIDLLPHVISAEPNQENNQ
jgi:hypothetical protein